MQLRTILISTGILAFATSLTLGGPTPTEPGKRTNANGDVPPLDVYVSHNPLRPGDLFVVKGIQGSPNPLTGYLVMCCDVGDNGFGCYDPDGSQFKYDGRPYALSDTVTFGPEQPFSELFPNLQIAAYCTAR
ncbi:hypothetical protein BC827DRAFT_426289 [Russula dissimulans]|nr:hypothetical protein BC827DRAFT_426289 [Russula dissimulans]